MASKSDWNVELSNRIFREEFYYDLTEETISGARRELMKFIKQYNSSSTHISKHSLIHLEYIPKYSSGDSSCLTSVRTYTENNT